MVPYLKVRGVTYNMGSHSALTPARLAGLVLHLPAPEG